MASVSVMRSLRWAWSACDAVEGGEDRHGDSEHAAKPDGQPLIEVAQICLGRETQVFQIGLGCETQAFHGVKQAFDVGLGGERLARNLGDDGHGGVGLFLGEAAGHEPMAGGVGVEEGRASAGTEGCADRASEDAGSDGDADRHLDPLGAVEAVVDRPASNFRSS